MRRYADPEPETLRFEAEGADAFYDTTTGNAGGKYADRDLDVDEIPGGGWHVGWVADGEWLEYQDVELGCGTYRFTARVGTRDGTKSMHLVVGGVVLPSVALPDTGDVYQFENVHMGEMQLSAGRYNMRLVFESTSCVHCFPCMLACLGCLCGALVYQH